MTQAEVLSALWDLQVEYPDSGIESAHVAERLGADAKDASRTLLRAFRNGRCGRHWVVRGGPGSGLYVYFVTQKGVDYVQWVEGQE